MGGCGVVRWDRTGKKRQVTFTAAATTPAAVAPAGAFGVVVNPFRGAVLLLCEKSLEIGVRFRFLHGSAAVRGLCFPSIRFCERLFGPVRRSTKNPLTIPCR